MSARTKYVVVGAVVAILAWWLLPNLAALLVTVAIVALPVAGYFMLDPSQRRRLRQARRRRIGP